MEKGDKVSRYENEGFGLRVALLEYESREEMLYMMDHMEEFCTVRLKQEGA